MLKLRRRTFSSLLASLPALGLTSSARANPGEPGNGTPKRFAIFVEGNGVRPSGFRDPLTQSALEGMAGMAVEDARQYTHTETLVYPNRPLEQARSLVALEGGGNEVSLVGRSAVLLGLSATYLGGGHTTEYGALTARRSSGVPTGPSIDTALGRVPGVCAGAPFEVVRLGVGSVVEPLNYTSAAFGHSAPAPIVLDPANAYASLFGSVAEGEASEKFKNRRRLLEFALVEIEHEKFGMGQSSRAMAKLDAYEQSVLDTIARDEIIEGMGATLGAHKPVEPGQLDPDPYASEALLDRLTLQVDLAIASLKAGLTNVVLISLGSGTYWANTYPTLAPLYPNGQMLAGHDLRHAGGDAYLGFLMDLSARYVEQACRLARALEAESEGSGTMLDNTAIVYMPDNGEKHHSIAVEWATLLMGGESMGLITGGQSVVYAPFDHENNRQTSNVFNTLLHAAGEPVDDFGHGNPATRKAEGPLGEIWG